MTRQGNASHDRTAEYFALASGSSRWGRASGGAAVVMPRAGAISGKCCCLPAKPVVRTEASNQRATRAPATREHGRALEETNPVRHCTRRREACAIEGGGSGHADHRRDMVLRPAAARQALPIAVAPNPAWERASELRRRRLAEQLDATLVTQHVSGTRRLGNSRRPPGELARTPARGSPARTLHQPCIRCGAGDPRPARRKMCAAHPGNPHDDLGAAQLSRGVQ